jgi:hypothetical protein
MTISRKKKLTQALLALMRLANLNKYATKRWKQRITDLAMKAYRGPRPIDEETEPMEVILAPAKVQELAERFVSIKHHKVPLKEIRRITSKTDPSLRNKIHDLHASLPADTEPPFPQMRGRFCIQREATQHPADTEERWDAYSPTAVKHVLGCWITLMDEVNEDAGGKHSGADPITAEIDFVFGLASYWEDCLENKVARWGEEPYSEKPINQDAGPFPRFVREAAKIIPRKYRPKSWNWAIRSAMDRLKKKSGEVRSQSAES